MATSKEALGSLLCNITESVKFGGWNSLRKEESSKKLKPSVPVTSEIK